MRYLFVIGDVFVTPGTVDPLNSLPAATLAAAAAFTVFDSPTGGTQITDLTEVDGVTVLTATTDSNGQPPQFRGPDGWFQPLYVDAGGSQRVPVYPLEALALAISNAATGTGGSGGGGTGTVTSGQITDASATGRAVLTASDPATALSSLGGIASTDSRLSDTRTPTDGSVTNAKVAANAAISADKLAAGATNGVITLAQLTALTTLLASAVKSADGTGFQILKRTLAQGAPGPADGNNGDLAAVATA